jgi:hypothetical protein
MEESMAEEGMTTAQILADLANPPASVRPMPFFVWNGDVTEARITEVLEHFSARGCGGAFIHPRPGLITEYLSERYFTLFCHAVTQSQRLGLECHIYDENSYPSGFAGGHTIASDPRTVATSLVGRWHHQPGQSGGGRGLPIFLGAFRCKPDGSYERVPGRALSEASPASPVLALEISHGSMNRFNAGFMYVDLARPETTRQFIKNTHEQYAAHVGDAFGRTIKYVFADEPETSSGHGLHMSGHLLAQFSADHGYDLAERLGDLCFDTPDSPAVRVDYFRTLNRLWINNYYRAIHDWCGQRGLMFTGHLDEHEWPLPAKQPDTMAALRWMQAPGNDLLAFQFSPDGKRDNRIWQLNLKELSSIANQCGRERVLVESCGGGGYDMGPRQFKPLEDYLMAFGVNVMNPHLSYQTLAGARKYDWAQTISDHAPWWDDYGRQTEHVGRTLAVLTPGCERNRVLVLHPTTTAWPWFRPGSFRRTDEKQTECDKKMAALREAQLAFVDALVGAQVDFDLGSELVMDELASVDGRGRLCVGERAYDLVVIPPVMELWLGGTLALLKTYLEAGGMVIAAGPLARMVDGRASDQPAELARRHASQWRTLDVAAAVQAVRAAVPPRVTGPGGEPLPKGLLFHRRELPGGQIALFFANPWTTPLKATATIEAGPLLELDTSTGQAHAAGDRGVIALDIPAFGHALYLIGEHAAQPRPAALRPGPVIELGRPNVRRLQPNVLVLDYCDLDAGRVSLRGVPVMHADRAAFEQHGFDGNPWSFGVQFRRTLMEAAIEPDSGFVLTYRFAIAPDALEKVRQSIEFAVERPRLYQVSVNGHELPFAKAARWLDEEIRRAPIGAFVQAGENAVTLRCRPFHVLAEIQNAYVLGDFALRPAERGFVIDLPGELTERDWRGQEMPFYCWSVLSEYPFKLASAAAGLHVSLPAWSGSAARISIDGEPAGTILYPPDELLIARPLSPGGHRLGVEIVGNMKNLMGPFFNDGLPGPWSWEQSPAAAPPGSAYRFYACGLDKPPTVSVLPVGG